MLSQEEIINKIQAGEMTSDEAYRLINELPENERMILNVEAVLVETISDTLRISLSRIDVNREMREYGFDSVTLAEFVNTINAIFRIDMIALTIFECPTLHELAQRIFKDYEKEILEYYSGEKKEKFKDDETQEVPKNDAIGATKEMYSCDPVCESFNWNIQLIPQPIYLLSAEKIINENHLLNFWYKLKKKEVKELLASNISIEQMKIMEEAGFRYFHLFVRTHQGFKVEMVVAGSGKPILILSGAGTTATFEYQQIQELSKDYQVIAFHLPSCGLSDGIDDLSLPSVCSYIINTVRQISVTFPLNIIGSSWGAVLAIKIASMYPELIETLVLVSGNTNRELVNSEAHNVNMTDVHAALYEELRKIKKGKDYWEIYEHSECIEPISFSAYIRYVNNEGSRELSVLHLLSSIKAPTLVVAGSEDKITNIIESRIIYSRIEDAEYYEIEGAGHVLLLTHAEQFNARVKRFYSQHI